MKVLWFTNSTAAAFSNALKGTGGWIEALDCALQGLVELHVAFLYPYDLKPFVNGRTTYHPIYTGGIVMNNIRRRFISDSKDRYTQKYIDLVKEVNPDIIHIHGTENTFHRILGKTQAPVVISVQGIPTVIAHKYNSGYYGSYINCKTTKRTLQSFLFGRASYKTIMRKLERFGNVEQDTFMLAKYIVGRTDWDRRVISVLAPGSKYLRVNEALRESFYQNKWEIEAPIERIVIHTTSGNSYFKGFETLCYALSLLNEMGIDTEWRVAGVSEGSSINRITKKCLGKNYPRKGLKLLGPLNEIELVDSLLSSHIYVMPSHIENSPNSLCEAMLLGMPCITTLAGGSDSILCHKREGLVIQDGDPWSMAGAILELKNDWGTALEYGKNAREHALERHDKKRIVDDLLSVYTEIINEADKS